MKLLVRAILQYYVNRMQHQEIVQRAFLKRYYIIPLKESKRILRRIVYDDIDEELRKPSNNQMRHYYKNCLRQIGVAPIHSNGRYYFKGLQKK